MPCYSSRRRNGVKRGDIVKIIQCDCTLWPLEHNGTEGIFESKTLGGNYYVNIIGGRCIAKKIRNQTTK